MQMYMSKPRLGVVTAAWANRPSASTVGALFFATDVGENGTLMVANGTRWRPMNGAAALKSMVDSSAAIANSETIVVQALLPAGLWQAGDNIRVWIAATMSGATDIGQLTVRVGTAGTTGDTAITGLSGFTFIAAAGTTGGGIFDIKLASATSAQRLGSTANNSSSYSTGAGASIPAATAITDASANALYVSVAVLSAGATNTITVPSAQIQLITP